MNSAFAHYITRPILHIGPLLFAAAVLSALVAAWTVRDEGYITAETGLGYWLGIVGAVMMLLLIGYPLRKRVRALTRLGRVANWFRIHMILGILGPAVIVLHTNFNLGSLNSRLALFTMLIVVASGIAGRYVYAKVHRGLYGTRLAADEVLADITTLYHDVCAAHGAGHALIEAELEGALQRLHKRRSLARHFIASLGGATRMRLARRRSRRALRQALRATPVGMSGHAQSRSERRQMERDMDARLKVFFAAVRKAERLAVFERIFGMWHHLHMPLFVLLSLTVVLHIVAVHRY